MSAAKRCVSSVKVVTFSCSMSVIVSSGCSINAPYQPEPALFTKMSIETPRVSSRDLSSVPAPGRARSKPSIATFTPSFWRSSAARRSIGSVRRAASTRFDLRAASSLANWTPKPLDAPVISDHLFRRSSIRAASLSIYRNVPMDLCLAGQDIAICLVLFGQGILYGHTDPARRQLDSARSARSGAACVIDEHPGFVGDVKDSQILRHWPPRIGCQKCDGACDCSPSPPARRWIACHGSKGLGLDLRWIDAKSEQEPLDLFHHVCRTANMRSSASNVGHALGEKGFTDPPDFAAPCLVSRIADRDGDTKIAVTRLQRFQLFSENEIARASEAEDEVHLPRPSRVAEISHDAHHWSNTHARAHKDDTVGPGSSENEFAIGGFDFHLVVDLELIVQPT